MKVNRKSLAILFLFLSIWITLFYTYLYVKIEVRQTRDTNIFEKYSIVLVEIEDFYIEDLT